MRSPFRVRVSVARSESQCCLRRPTRCVLLCANTRWDLPPANSVAACPSTSHPPPQRVEERIAAVQYHGGPRHAAKANRSRNRRRRQARQGEAVINRMPPRHVSSCFPHRTPSTPFGRRRNRPPYDSLPSARLAPTSSTAVGLTICLPARQ